MKFEKLGELPLGHGRLGMTGFAFMEDDDVSIRVLHHKHVADGRLKRAHFDGRLGSVDGRDGAFKVFNFKSDAASIWRRFPAGCRADCQGPCTDIIFYPVTTFTFASVHGESEAKNTFIEFPCPSEIRHRIAGKRDFGDFHDEVRRVMYLGSQEVWMTAITSIKSPAQVELSVDFKNRELKKPPRRSCVHRLPCHPQRRCSARTRRAWPCPFLRCYLRGGQRVGSAGQSPWQRR